MLKSPAHGVRQYFPSWIKQPSTSFHQACTRWREEMSGEASSFSTSQYSNPRAKLTRSYLISTTPVGCGLDFFRSGSRWQVLEHYKCLFQASACGHWCFWASQSFLALSLMVLL